MKEPRRDWTLDSEGSAWAAEETYEQRKIRERMAEAARDARRSAGKLLGKRDR